jgi:hypothetical protein
MKKEIVISVFEKNIDWIEKLNEEVKVTIYRKGDYPKSKFNEIKIESNVGRDVHAFFYHIVENYEKLSDITFFVQDFPFDHWGNVIDVINDLNNLSTCSLNFDGYYGFHNNQFGSAWALKHSNQFGGGFILSCTSTGSPQHIHENLNLNHFWYKFFSSPSPSEYEFMPGGHFAITKEQIRTRPKNFYQKIITFLETENIAPWVIERFECYIFNPNFKVNE